MTFESLSVDRQERVNNIVKGFIFTPENIFNYADVVSEDISKESKRLFKQLGKNTNLVGMQLLEETVENLEVVNDKPTKICVVPKGLFKGRTIKRVEETFNEFEKVQEEIRKVKDKLTYVDFELAKDIIGCKRIYERDIHSIESLDEYIIAGNILVNQEKEEYQVESKDENMELDIFRDNERKTVVKNLEHFERKLVDLQLLREVTVQNIAQIELIMGGDEALRSKINDVLSTVIPLWESQMLITLQILRQSNSRESCDILLAKTSEKVMEYEERVVETGELNIEELKEVNKNLLETVKEVKEIRKQVDTEKDKFTELEKKGN